MGDGSEGPRHIPMTTPPTADDAEVAKRRVTADALASECDRLRAARDLLTAHLSRLSPRVGTEGAMNTSFGDDRDDDTRSVFDQSENDQSETASVYSHATHTTATTAVSRGAKSRGGKSMGGASRKSRRSKKSRKNQGGQGGALAMLSAREKRVLANSELETLERELELDLAEGEKKLDGLRAKVEETEMRLQSTTKEMFEFDRDVCGDDGLKGNPRGLTLKRSASQSNLHLNSSGAISSERWTKHVDSLSTSKKAEAEQFHLKTNSAKLKCKQLELTLRQKERAGEHLTAVDHATLLIERNRRHERLEVRNAELRRLASVASRAGDQLSKCKLELENQSGEGQFLKADMAAKRVMILSFDVLMIQVKADHAKVKKSNKDLHVAGSSGDNPPVGEYVRVKDLARELEGKVRDAERKLELAKAKKRQGESMRATRRVLGGNSAVKGLGSTGRVPGRV